MVDIFNLQEEVPADVIGDVDECREKFLEGIVCVCDETMEKYLDGQEIEIEKLQGCFTTAVASGSVVPILCCDNKKDLGIEEIVDVISKYTPSPEKGLIRKYVEMEGDEVTTEEKCVEVSKSAPFSAQVFKSITDPFVGKLSFFRVYSGDLKIILKFTTRVQRRTKRLGTCSKLSEKNSRKSRVPYLVILLRFQKSMIYLFQIHYVILTRKLSLRILNFQILWLLWLSSLKAVERNRR